MIKINPPLHFRTGVAVSGNQFKDNRARRLVAAGVLLLGISTPLTSQTKRPNDPSPLELPGHHYDLPATLITAAEVEAHKKKIVAAGLDDVPMTMVKAGGMGDKHQVGISVVTRAKEAKTPNYAVHDDVAEVYYIVEGKGHMKIGGKLKDWKRRPISPGNGQGSAGTVSEGAKDFTLSKGDVLVIPAGTPHKWEGSEKFTSYVVVRVDPDGVAPLLALGSATFARE